MGEIYNRFLKRVKDRRDKALSGKINSIPSPFTRFSDDLLGIEQGKYYVVSAYTKGAKTQFTQFFFIFQPLLYAYFNKDKARVKFFLYLLEETSDDLIARLLSFLMFHFSEGKKSIDKDTMLSTMNGKILSEEILDFMQSDQIVDIVDFFESNAFFSPSKNPTGMWNECVAYAKANGITHTKPKKYKDELGNIQETQGFDYYESNDPDEYRIVITDHVSLLSPERGWDLKQTIDKHGEYCIDLRDMYNFTMVDVQQQNTENESKDALKMNRIRPTYVGLADSKYTGRNCSMMLGLTSPERFEIPEYHGYDIKRLRDNVRFLEVVLNRGGRMGGMVALYFNGATATFMELPKPGTPELEQWYEMIENQNRKKTGRVFLLFKKHK